MPRCADCKIRSSEKYNATVSELAGRGYRALGVAKSDDAGKTWTILGILPMMDPPRPDAKQTVAETKKLGLSVKMVTGDDVAIGDEIAAQLGLGDHLVAAADIFDAKRHGDHAPVDVARAVETSRRLCARVPAAQIRDRRKPCSRAATSSP